MQYLLFQTSKPRDIVVKKSEPRQRSISLTQGPNQALLQKPKTKLLPTVFKWDRGGKHVYISGSYDNWKTKTPLTKKYVESACVLLRQNLKLTVCLMLL